MTGAADPFVPEAQVRGVRKEMKAAGASSRWSATRERSTASPIPTPAPIGMDALTYDAAADKKSWDAMLKTFRAAFK